MSNADPRSSGEVPRAALLLGAGGVLPFLAAALGVLFADHLYPFSLLALITYGAVILSFLGGIRWGLAIAGMVPRAALARALIVSVVPALLGWAALLLSLRQGYLLLVVAFVVALLDDVAATRRGEAPPWYPKLRLPLTLAAAACLALGVFA